MKQNNLRQTQRKQNEKRKAKKLEERENEMQWKEERGFWVDGH